MKPKNDISEETLAHLRNICPSPKLLDKIVKLSRAEFGWYTKQWLRGLEYPWIIKTIGDNLNGLRILDVGAGVSPVPIMLARAGAEVTTVDYNEVVRANPENCRNWNEWGFLNYSLFEPTISSFNCSILDFEAAKPFDFIYTISVVEHMPATLRRNFIKKASELMVRGGLLLITVDIEPCSNQLWNLDRGQVVDKPGEHGDVNALENEISNYFKIERTEITRRLSIQAGDVMLISARK